MPDFSYNVLTSETFKILNKNPISSLQELCQSRAVELEYVQLANSGPDHSKTYEFVLIYYMYILTHRTGWSGGRIMA